MQTNQRSGSGNIQKLMRRLRENNRKENNGKIYFRDNSDQCSCNFWHYYFFLKFISLLRRLRTKENILKEKHFFIIK